MALLPIVSAGDGVRVTVNQLVASPRVIPMRILAMMENQFIADSILRDGGDMPGGVAQFWESTPLFADSGSAIREEFAEYRIVTTSLGIPSIAVTVNRGLSIMVSEEMRRRNQMDRVTTQMTQVKNTMVRDWDTAFRNSIINNASIPVHVAGKEIDGTGTAAPWDVGTPKIRKDILLAQRIIKQAITGDQADNFLGFIPDTMVISTSDSDLILLDSTFNNVYQGNIANENLLYTGLFPNKILGLDTLMAPTWPSGTVLVCQRSVLGFIGNERPTQATPLYEKQETETWRSDVSRISGMGIDQPLAACLITGVDS